MHKYDEFYISQIMVLPYCEVNYVATYLSTMVHNLQLDSKCVNNLDKVQQFKLT